MMGDNRYAMIVLLAVSVMAACGGGGGGGGGPIGGGGPSNNLAATFTADQAAPGADSVSLAELSSNGNTVTVRVNLTDVNGVYGALFDLTYPAGVASLSGWAAGTALEQGGNNVSYVVDEPVAGRLVVSVSRLGGASGANVSGSQPLVDLIFQATTAGNGAVAFANMALVDDQGADLPGIVWDGGTLAAN